MSLHVLDTFAGAGGFSLGFQMAGCEVLGAIETDSWATETFQANHPESFAIEKDMENLSEKELLTALGGRQVDVVLGGPPCQGFSICNKNAGDAKDPRNSLFREFIRIGRIVSPHVMIMENVPNLIKAKTENNIPVLDIIVQELSSLGYHVYHDILEATSYGVPQIRRRLFVIASKSALDQPFPEATYKWFNGSQPNLFEQNLKHTPTLWDAISDLPEIDAREGSEVSSYTKEPLNDYQAYLRSDSDVLYNHLSMKHSKRMVERFMAMECGQSVSDVPDHLKPFARNSNGTRLGNSYDQNNRRMHPDRPCHTIPASFYANFVHPFRHRNFTAREGARIQSFPDWYVFKGKPTVVSRKLLAREGRHKENYLCQYNQIGNAVPPLLAKAVSENLIKQLNLCMSTAII